MAVIEEKNWYKSNQSKAGEGSYKEGRFPLGEIVRAMQNFSLFVSSPRKIPPSRKQAFKRPH